MIDLPLLFDSEEKSSPLTNRIRKNYRHLRKWAQRTQTNAFRLYDRDIKEYPLALDYYDGKICAHTFLLDEEKEEPLIEEALFALKTLFGLSEESVFLRNRIKRKKLEQYEKAASEGLSFVVKEYGVKFQVNLTDYLDTGLFLDHRETRQMVAKKSKGKSLLNLFCYTGAFSLHAAVQGAFSTKSVDMSNTYLAWAKENFHLNDISLQNHEFVRADCLVFLEEEQRSGRKYDLIVCDPPTISRSKKMEEMFDVQKDHVFLIRKALSLLSEGGTLFFSTNSRKFRFDLESFSECRVRDISSQSIPLDFHDQKIHKLWKIEKN